MDSVSDNGRNVLFNLSLCKGCSCSIHPILLFFDLYFQVHKTDKVKGDHYKRCLYAKGKYKIRSCNSYYAIEVGLRLLHPQKGKQEQWQQNSLLKLYAKPSSNKVTVFWYHKTIPSHSSTIYTNKYCHHPTDPSI